MVSVWLVFLLSVFTPLLLGVYHITFTYPTYPTYPADNEPYCSADATLYYTLL